MFKHILLPTDGSRLADKGVRAGLALARALGARATGLYVILPFVPAIMGEGSVYYPALAPGDYDKVAGAQARKTLAAIEAQARRAGVRYASRILKDDPPWRGILKAARAAKCDAVVMASHGRGGLGGLILGSETQQVLARSKIPVVVVR
jgi:nucleotide-binding universal stress UspA family protein